jgi:glycosyltransferase involved in cell wall biosynthesis
MMLSTLHVCTSNSWGGLELYACTMMAELHAAGHGVTAVCQRNSKVEAFLTAHNIPCFHLPGDSPLSIRSILFLRTLIRQNNYHVVHAHFHKDVWTASFAVRQKKSVKLFYSVYMGIASKDDFWHRFIFRRVDGFFTSSKAWSERLAELFAVPKERIHHLPYGRALGEYTVDPHKREAIRAHYGVSADEILVGTMVRLDPAKGALDFAESYMHLDPAVRQKVKYLIVGEPTRKPHVNQNESPFEERSEEYLQHIQALIKEHHLESIILLAGFQQDIVGYLSALDVFVFPSRNELFSLVMLDAMGMSLPIAASREGGNLEQIEEGVCGLLFEKANPLDLAKTLSVYVTDPNLRKQHGMHARRFVETHHSMKNTISQLTRIYQAS